MSKPHRSRVRAALRHYFEIERLEQRLLLSNFVRFAAEQTFGVGSSPDSLVAADLNGDGKTDLAVANYGSNSVGVLLGNGNGTFHREQEFSVGQHPLGVAVADVNGDGKPDLIAANSYNGTVSVLLGNGNGTFQNQRTFSAGSGAANVVAADVNGDGKPDLIVTNQLAYTVSVLLGNGNGTFQAQRTFAVGAFPDPVAVGDLNGDGKPDVVVGNNGATSISILLGNGNGTFQAQQTVNVAVAPSGLALADLNADGKLDLVVASSQSNVSAVDVLLGNGNGTFQARQTFATGRSPAAVVVADLNGDGKPDLAVTNYGNMTVGALLGNGNGAFLPQQTTALSSFAGEITAADLDGDGTPDLIAVQQNTNSVGVLLNRLAPMVLSINGTSPVGSVDSAASATFTITFNKTMTGVVGSDFSVVTTGGVTFTSTTLTPVSGSVYTLTVNGISGIGTLGLNLVDNGTIHDLAGQQLVGGIPSFSSQQTFNAGDYAYAVATGDLNGDGKPDVVVAQRFAFGSVGVLLGNGNGSLQGQRTFGAGTRPDAVTIADVNGDGKLDLVVANYGNLDQSPPHSNIYGSLSVLLGNGNGTFQTQRTFAPAGVDFPSSVAVTDINGDGKPDLVVGGVDLRYNIAYPTANVYSRVVVMLGNGNGTFQAAQNITIRDRRATFPVTADFNGDGKPDLAFTTLEYTAGTYSGRVHLLLGNGNGTFQTDRTFDIGPVEAALLAGDVNGDGDADLVATSQGGAEVFLGQGNGNLTPVGGFSGFGENFSQMVLVDLNGDGKPDLAGAHVGDIGILPGNGDGSFGGFVDFTATETGAIATADLNGDGRPDLVTSYSAGNSTVTVLLGGPGGSFNGQVYTIVPPPMVTSIDVSAPSTPITSASSLSFAVNFTSNVTNVLASDFQLVTTGDIVATTPVVLSGSGSSYTVTVNGVHGNGTLGLELVDNDTIIDSSGTPLGGAGMGNGSFAGQLYTILQTFPTVLSINRTSPPGPTTVDSSVSFTFTFSEAVTGVAPANFSLALAGVSTTPPLVVTGSGAVYTVTVNGISGSGTLGLNLVDNGAIRDSAGNPLQCGPTSFANQQTFAAGSSTSSVAPADVNGDGKPDLIVANDLGGSAGAVSVLLSNGNGTFAADHTFAAGPNPYSVVTADVNGDGNPDLIVVNENGNGTVSVLLGNGNGTFGAPQSFAIGANPRSVVAADLNGDGRPDLVVGSSGFVSVLLGNGNGTFQAQSTFAAGTHPYSVAVADVNGDAMPDLLAANLGSNSVSVLLGNGNGTFQAQQTFAAASSPRALAAADVNGDGKLDLIVPSSNSSAVGILLGNGNGTFQSQQTFAATSASYGLAVLDVNGDGKLDLALGSNSTSAVTLLLGNGNGTFQAPQTFGTGGSPLSLAFADFNADGRPDLATANNGSNTASVLLNNSNGNFAGQTYIIGPPADSINGTAGADTVTLTRDSDGTDIDWNLLSSNGSSNGMLPVNDPHGLTINGNGGSDTIILSNSNGNPLPNAIHLNGNFTIIGLSATNPFANTTLEIGRSAVFINYSNGPDPLALIQGYLKNGYNNGAWNGTPTASTGVITSAAAQANANHTTGIGYADWADGQGVNTMANTIELTYTLYGDANLDHQVNSADLQILLFNLNRPGAWDQGDFNYDAQVNSADLQNLLFTLNTSLGSQATPLAVAAATPAASAPSSASDSSSQLMPLISTTGLATTPLHHPHLKVAARKRR